MKVVLKKWLVLGLALLAVAAAMGMAQVRTGQPARDAGTDASLPPMIAAISLQDLFPH